MPERPPSSRTVGLAAVAATTTLFGMPLAGILLSLLGLGDAIVTSDRSEQIELEGRLSPRSADQVLCWARSSGLTTNRYEIEAGIRLAGLYLDRNPLDVARLLEADFDAARLGDQVAAMARRWYGAAEPWSEEPRYVIAARAIGEAGRRTIAAVRAREPVIIPLVLALRGSAGADLPAVQGTATALATVTAVVADRTRGDLGADAEGVIAIGAEGSSNRAVDRLRRVWKDHTWLTQAGVLIMLATLLWSVVFSLWTA